MQKSSKLYWTLEYLSRKCNDPTTPINQAISNPIKKNATPLLFSAIVTSLIDFNTRKFRINIPDLGDFNGVCRSSKSVCVGESIFVFVSRVDPAGFFCEFQHDTSESI
jgi:hypothetical protein